MRYLLTALSILVFTSCYVDEPRPPATPGMEDNYQSEFYLDGVCEHEIYSGCFSGRISSAMDLEVEGRKFHDANDLASRFYSLITVEGEEGQERVHGVDYVLDLVDEFSNDSFHDDFEVVVRGTNQEVNEQPETSSFTIDNVAHDDRLKVRVQKRVRYNLVKLDDNGERIEDQSVERCATVYSDVSVKIKQNEKHQHDFFEFKLFQTDDSCVDEQVGGHITF